MNEAAAVPVDYETLIRTHQAGLWRYVHLLGCDPAQADDLTQDTFVAVLQGSFEPRSDSSTRAFLRIVARRLFLKKVARDRHRFEGNDLDEVDALWERTAADGGEARLEALRACLEDLEERDRVALELRYRDGASRAEMATTLELSEGGVKNLLGRLKGRLRLCVERKLRHGDHTT